MIGFNLPLHLSTAICIAVAEVHKSWYRSYMSWECGLLMSGALSNHKVLLASLGIVGFGGFLVTFGFIGMGFLYYSVFIVLTIYYLTLQIWSMMILFFLKEIEFCIS